MSTERFVILIAVLVAMLSMTLFVAAQLFEQNDDFEMCLLYELEAHRENSYDADRDSATAHQQPFNVPAPPPDGLDPRMKQACDRIKE